MSGPWPSRCELLVVDESGDDVLLDAVTIEPHVDGDEVVPAGIPVTWWLTNPTGVKGKLAADLRALVQEGDCRIGPMRVNGQDVLVVTGGDDCMLVVLTAAGE